MLVMTVNLHLVFDSKINFSYSVDNPIGAIVSKLGFKGSGDDDLQKTLGVSDTKPGF